MRALLVAALSTAVRSSDSGSGAVWPRVLLPTDDGARALDGSPAALYLRPGVGANASNIVLFFEGGGWCESLEDCAARSMTALGSSNFSTDGYSSRDLLQTNCSVNPSLCDYSFVYAQYLDGSSRSSDVSEPVLVGDKLLYFRGHRILRATLAALLASGGPGAGFPSLSNAPRLLVTGSSAGGLTSILHIDEIAAAVHDVNPSCDVRVIPEVGFFLDGEDIWQQRIMTKVFARVANFSNVTTGSPTQVNAACVAATPANLRWQCFFAQYTLPYLTTPSFIVNSYVDEWQTENVLAPSLNYTVGVSTYPPFKPCILAPTVSASASCNATQASQWVGYGQQFLAGLAAARAAVPAHVAAVSGGVITSCPIHTTLIGGLSHRIIVGGLSLYEHIARFLNGGSGWTIDGPYPDNKSCPKPSEVHTMYE